MLHLVTLRNYSINVNELTRRRPNGRQGSKRPELPIVRSKVLQSRWPFRPLKIVTEVTNEKDGMPAKTYIFKITSYKMKRSLSVSRKATVDVMTPHHQTEVLVPLLPESASINIITKAKQPNKCILR